MEISFSLDRIKALKVTNTKVRKGMKFRYKLAISLVVSLILAGPNYLISRRITPVGILVSSNKTLYVLSTLPIFESFFWSIGLSVLNILRGIAPMLLLSIFNIFLIHEFSNKETQQISIANLPVQTKIKEMDISKLVTAINAIYLIGYLPIFLSPIFFLHFESTSTIYSYYFTVASMLAIFSHYSNIFIFYKLSPSFKNFFLKKFSNK